MRLACNQLEQRQDAEGNYIAMLGLFFVVCGSCAPSCLVQGMRSATCITALVLVSSLGHEVAARGLQLLSTFASFVCMSVFKCVLCVLLAGYRLQSFTTVCMYSASIYSAICSIPSMLSVLAVLVMFTSSFGTCTSVQVTDLAAGISLLQE